MDDLLYRKAVSGAVVLTVNKRLARHLHSRFDLARRNEGLNAWPRGEILSLTAWLNGALWNLPEGAAILSREQSLRVWETIVEKDLAGSGGHQLLQVPQTARRAHQAHQLLRQHCVVVNNLASSADHQAFLRWQERWRQIASASGWKDAAETIWMVAAAIDGQHLQPPGQVVLAGFDQLTPDILHLCDVLRRRGCHVEEWQSPCFPEACRRQIIALDPADEVRSCAIWARQILSENPAADIGIVVPQLDVYQKLFESILPAELDPSSILAGVEVADTFNMSLGHQLEREGPVRAALRLLQLRNEVSFEDISWLLRSPYIGDSRRESAWRARLDKELRSLGQVAWPLPRLVRTVKYFAGRFGGVELQVGQVFELLAEELRRSVKKLPGDWAEHFIRLLRKLGWPGDRGLSSREHQVVDTFSTVLSTMASLDRVSGPVSRPVAVGMLGRLAVQTEFQAESSGEAIQILGILEASGLTFDHLWVAGLHDMALPQPPAPNPFIPLAIQRRHGMPHADAERERLFASRVAQRLFSAAPQVYLSWPRQIDGLEQRPSPLLDGIDAVPAPVSVSVDPGGLIWSARPELEQVDDLLARGVNSKKSFRGGTGILKDQALCPFRAFGHYRLHAQRLESPEIGLDGMARGTLAHAVLELFWKDVRDQATLAGLDEVQREAKISVCVQQALARFEKEKRRDLPLRLRRLEQQRLANLVRQWLDIEARRAPFRVEGTEVTSQLTIGSLRIRARIDRIDRLDGGGLAIIDYKTGRPDPGQWFDDRVTEPQLPAYCLDVGNDRIDGVLFAVVRGKRSETGFRGLARDPDAWPGLNSRSCAARLAEKGWTGLDDVLSHWAKVLTGLADAFARGEAAVDPVGFDVACKYCDLTPLCRINDLGLHLTLQEERHD